jgi:hypothetical protein
MKLEIIRTYHAHGTNGTLYYNSMPIVFTIELPWLDNKPKVSCIPEGEYRMVFRYSLKHRAHLWLQQVPGRDLILMHPANHALTELMGCIAPVSVLTAPGQGTGSRLAMSKLLEIAHAIADKEPLFISIKS